MPVPQITPHPDYFDRIYIGGVTFYLNDAMATARLIVEAVQAQQAKEKQWQSLCDRVTQFVPKDQPQPVAAEPVSLPAAEPSPEFKLEPKPPTRRSAKKSEETRTGS